MVLLPLRAAEQEAVHGGGLRLSRAVHPPGLRLSNGLLLLCRGGVGFARHEWGEEDYSLPVYTVCEMKRIAPTHLYIVIYPPCSERQAAHIYLLGTRWSVLF